MIRLVSIAWVLLVLGCDRGKDDAEPGPMCGALSCASDEVCVEDRFDPSCSTLAEGNSCPPGTSEGACGGAGIPCCCAPPPATEHRCESASGCDGPLLCTCLGMICTADKSCGAMEEDMPYFFCATPPAP